MKHIKIWPIVCPHFGARACNLSLFEEHRDRAVKEKWRVVLLGDLVNNGISAGSKHVGLEFQDAMDPMAQVEQAVDVLLPMAPQIEALVGGNHPLRSVKACGLHPEKLIAMFLSIAAGGKAPKAIMPSIIQRVHEVAYLGQFANTNGRNFGKYSEAKEKLLSEIRKVEPGPENRWDIPFFPGVASIKIDGISTACHHGTHGKSKDNWQMLWQAIPGHRLYLTGHNHSLDWSGRRCRIAGKVQDTDFFSCGTYQGYEEYAAIACYPETPVGSLLLDYDHDKDEVTFTPLR